MNMENNNYKAPEQKKEKESGSTEQTILKRGTEAYGQAEQAVNEAYDKTSEKVSKTYEQAKNYSSDHPGQTILISFGIGLGLGLLLGASTHRSSSRRFARPVINALSDVASEFFR